MFKLESQICPVKLMGLFMTSSHEFEFILSLNYNFTN